jgi:hypothetical protein
MTMTDRTINPGAIRLGFMRLIIGQVQYGATSKEQNGRSRGDAGRRRALRHVYAHADHPIVERLDVRLVSVVRSGPFVSALPRPAGHHLPRLRTRA